MTDLVYPTTVKVFDAEQYDGDWMPENLAEAVVWLQSKLESIPQEYRASASIEIESISSWEDSHYARIQIEYTRPPTEAEIAERKADLRRRAQEDLEWAERRVAQERQRIAQLG